MAEGFFTAKQVMERYHFTEMTLWRWLNSDKVGFPKPMVINRRRLFREEDIASWERQKAAGAA